MNAPLKERLGFGSEPVFLVDGTAYVYRSFYAYPDLKRSDGFPTNALYIVLRLLLKLIREEHPRHLGFFLDGRGPTFRHGLYAPYKAQRTATPEPLIAQLEPIRRAVELLGFTVRVSDGEEADDLIAGLAARCKAERPVVIVGADKDLRQCLDERVVLWDPMAKKESLHTLASFRAETGLEPEQWPDFQAVIGDSSDNIPGVPGVGPKGAAKIFERYRSVHEIVADPGRLTPAERKKFDPVLAELPLYRQLTALRQEAGADLDPAALRRRPLQRQALAAFFEEFEFRSLLKELPPETEPVGLGLPDVPPVAPPARQGERATEVAPEPAPEAPAPEVPGAAPGTESGEAAGEVSAEAGGAGVPLQTEIAPPWEDLAVLVKGQEVGLVPARMGCVLVALADREFLCMEPLAALPKALAEARTVYAPDVKALLRAAPYWSELPLGLWFDLGLAAYLLNPEERDYGFEHLQQRFPVAAHAQNPGCRALAVGQELSRRLAEVELGKLLRELETPLIPVLAHMEEAGIRIDQEAFAAFLREVQRDIEALTGEIYAAAGGPFNIRSSQQLGQVLFETLQLKPAGKTPGGSASTSQAALEKLAGRHPIIERLMEFRKLEKLRSTYLEPLPRLVDAQNRLHTTFNQLATATGRLSSSSPNLQNIPIRGPQGRRMRSCFCAAEGCELVAADYSQIELRVLAHCSQDSTLLEAFAAGEDIHSRTAALLFDKSQDAVTPDERRSAKTINFGLIYGMGAQKLGQDLGIPLKEAKAFIERYFSRLQALKTFYEQVVETAREQGYVSTLAGRRRYLPDIVSRNAMLQAQARRQAVNTVIQGSAADIIKAAMIRADRDEVLQQLEARLILQVHDELVLEVPARQAQKAGKHLAAIMAGVVDPKSFRTPLKVDWGHGRTWAEAH